MSHIQTSSGVPGIGNIGWGTHFCHFYEGPHDLGDTLVPFFRAGLENNEACLWVTCHPYTADEARRALAAVVPDFAQRELDGQIEIIDHDAWYLKMGRREPQAVLDGWLEREAAALDRGFAGLRLTGNTYWLERPNWDSFVEYETLVNEAFRQQRIVALCSYCLGRCTPQDVLDVVRNHQFTVSRRKGEWEVLEAASLKLARQDLLRLQQSEQTLRDADQRKDEFLAMLAHELRNPLAPIRTGIDILSLDNGSRPEILELMRRQVEHLVRLVDDLLDMSRIMRGTIELRREPVELRTVINRASETVRPSIEELQQELVVSMPGKTIWLDADPVRIVQVVGNLLNNASKFTPANGRIEIEATIVDQMADLAVRDNGIGIDPNLLPEIFELFLQANPTLDRTQGGLGIGLTLVQRLVEMHGGTVSAHSAGLGQGSEFRVRIPLCQSPNKAATSAQPVQNAPSRRVLVVDDNLEAATILSMLLRKLGSKEVEIATDGLTALAKIESSHPEVVLLDIGLPQMNGYEVAEHIRRRPEFDDVLLVAVTGYGQEEHRQRATEAGFDAHYVKPVAIESILNLLSHSKLTGT